MNGEEYVDDLFAFMFSVLHYKYRDTQHAHSRELVVVSSVFVRRIIMKKKKSFQVSEI